VRRSGGFRLAVFGAMVSSLGLGLAACDPTIRQPLEEVGWERPVWPPPPAAARVGFVNAFTGPADLGISKTFAQRLGELLTGPSDVRLVRPMAVVVDTDGVIYVADPGARGVHRFDPRGGRYRLIRGAGGRPLPSPVALAVGRADEVYISDSRLSALFVVEAGAEEAVRVPLQGLLAQPTGVALDDAGVRLYLVDTGSHQVKVFGRDGALVTSFGRRGTGPGEFNFPTMIWRDGEDRLLIADSLNFRIQVFDTDGRFVRQFGELGDGTGEHARPKGVAADALGHIYVVDSLFHTLQIFDPNGAFLLNVGRQGSARGEFWLPTGIFIDTRDTIYIADSQNRRVQVFRYLSQAP
jgi:DNA-binding beta-propeller fold protein YncE